MHRAEAHHRGHIAIPYLRHIADIWLGLRIENPTSVHSCRPFSWRRYGIFHEQIYHLGCWIWLALRKGAARPAITTMCATLQKPLAIERTALRNIFAQGSSVINRSCWWKFLHG
jgi:hypothetical protein